MKNLGSLFLLGLSQLSIVFAGLVGLKIFTNILGPDIFGEVNLYMTFSIFMSMLIYGPLTNGLQRISAIAISNQESFLFFKTVNNLILKISIILFTTFFLVLLFGYFFHFQVSFLKFLSVLIFAIVSGSAACYVGMLNIFQRKFEFSIIQALIPWMRIFLSIQFLSTSSNNKLANYYFGYFFADFIILIICIIIFYKNLKIDNGLTENGKNYNQFDYIRKLKNYVLPFVLWGVFSWVQSSSDRWAIKLFGTNKDLGNYIVLWQLGFYPITMISSVLIQFSQPFIYRFNNKNFFSHNEFVDFEKIFKLLIASIILIFLLILFISIKFHEFILLIVPNKKFLISTNLLPIVILSSIFISIGQVFALIFSVTLNSKKLLPYQISMPIILLLVLLIAAYNFHLLGVVYGSLLYSFLYMTIMIVISIKELNILRVSSKLSISS